MRRPTAQDMAQFYPKAAADAGVSGRATIACTVDATGRLADCSVVEEDPPGAGFGAAAVEMGTKAFMMRPMTKDGMPVAGGHVRIPIRFVAPPPEPAPVARQIIRPDWIRKATGEDMARGFPRRAMAHGVSGRATAECRVTAQGTLTDCILVLEEPAGLDIGAATLKLMEKFQMGPVDAEGLPVAGGVVRIPVRWVLPR